MKRFVLLLLAVAVTIAPGALAMMNKDIWVQSLIAFSPAQGKTLLQAARDIAGQPQVSDVYFFECLDRYDRADPASLHVFTAAIDALDAAARAAGALDYSDLDGPAARTAVLAPLRRDDLWTRLQLELDACLRANPRARANMRP